MTGKLVGGFIVLTAVIGGMAMYYLQVHAFYDEVAMDELDIRLTFAATGVPSPILTEDIRAIDADSSPLRFRACFTTPHSPTMLANRFTVYNNPVPLTGPGWFDCYDAGEVGRALEADAATAYLAEANIHDGVDRVVAIFSDGRGFVWHQLNEKHRD